MDVEDQRENNHSMSLAKYRSLSCLQLKTNKMTYIFQNTISSRWWSSWISKIWVRHQKRI